MSLEFRHIAHAYGQNWALRDVSFTAPQGEITCLLGSSGCGKSTLLNLAAGLLPVQQGSVLLDGDLLANERHSPPPEQRPVGLVFQDGALFPHMTIAQNVAFGMDQAAQRSGEVEQWVSRVGLGAMGERYPHQLSGGQQQRAALARAMAPHPQVLLMDEPFASVDIVLRRSLRRECRNLLRDRGATVILVTHDPEEALDIGDRIALMEAGEITQFGTPQELYDVPVSASVGTIFGDAQLVRAERREGALQTNFGLWSMASLVQDAPESRSLDLLLRAGGLDLEPDPSGLVVRDIRSKGAIVEAVLVNSKGEELSTPIMGLDGMTVGARYRATPRPGSLIAFSASDRD